MLIRLLLLLTIVPLTELSLLLWLSDLTDWRFTLALVIGTGIAGSWMLRRQGWRTWQRVQEDLRSGRLPAESLQDGLMIMLAAALLITPGVLTDAAGLLLLMPGVRNLAKGWLARRFKENVVFRSFARAGAASWSSGAAHWSAGDASNDDEITDVPSRPVARHIE